MVSHVIVRNHKDRIFSHFSPDYTGLHQSGEIVNFWIHHWILFIIPFHLLLIRYYTIDYSGAYYYRLAAFLGKYDILLFFDNLKAVCYITISMYLSTFCQVRM
jgi:hypothetical protein